MNPEILDPSREDDPNSVPTEWIMAYEDHIIRGGPAPEGFPKGLSDEAQQHFDDARRAIDKLHKAFGNDSTPSVESVSESFPQPLGDFQILREIGRGGMGIVYEAKQLSMGRMVALKTLPLAAMLDKKRIERFDNEVRAAATLDHPHCVPIYGVGEERGVHFYAMKLIHGQSLAEVIEELKNRSSLLGVSDARTISPPLLNDPTAGQRRDKQKEKSPVTATVRDEGSSIDKLSVSRTSHKRDYFRRIAELGAQAADALQHAHEQGIVHRDIKPGNLLFDAKGKIWVTDFGLARIEADAGVTQTGDLIGTLRYMSPEQALGKRELVDHRVDIYSLGATLYELLALRPAIQGEDRALMLKQFAEADPIALRKIDPSIPVEIETIIGKAIEKNPTDRYATAADLADDFRHALAHEPIMAKRSTYTGRTAKWIRRYPVLTVLLVVIIVAFTSILGLSLRHARQLTQVNVNLSDSLSESERLRDDATVQQAQTSRAKYIVDMRLANRSLQDGLFESARTRLEQYLPPSTSAKDRDFPWYYLWQQCQDAKKVFQGHVGMVRSFTIVPKSELVISAGDDKTVRFFNSHTQEQMAILTDFTGKVYAVAVTQDEQTLFTAGEKGELLAWDISEAVKGIKPTQLARLKGHTDDVLCLAISPDGKRLATAGHDGQIFLWDIPTLEQVSILEGHTDWVRGLDFSPDGATLASVSHDDYLIHWDIHEAEEKQRVKIVNEEHKLGLSVCFHTSGEFIATGNSYGEVQLIQTHDFRIVSKYEMPTSWIRSLDFSDDGQLLVVAGNNPFIHLLRVDSQMQMAPWRTLSGLQRETWCVRFRGDNRFLLSSGSSGDTIFRNIGLFDSATSKINPNWGINQKIFHEVLRRRLTISRDRNTMFLSGKHQILLFNLNDLQNPNLVARRWDYVASFGGVISPDGRRVGFLRWRTLDLTPTQPPFRRQHILEETSPSTLPLFSTLSFHPTRDVIAVGRCSGQLSVTNVLTEEKLFESKPFGESWIVDVLFTSDGRYFVACFCNLFADEPATAVVWDADSYAEVARVEDVVRLLAVAPHDCQLALVSRDQSIQLWNVDAQSTAMTFQGHSSKVISGDFSPDGKYLATTAQSGPIKVWSIETGQLILDIDHDLRFPQVVFGPDYSLIATDLEVITNKPKVDYQHHLVPLLEQHLESAPHVDKE